LTALLQAAAAAAAVLTLEALLLAQARVAKFRLLTPKGD
jgi:hypothetical protein